MQQVIFLNPNRNFVEESGMFVKYIGPHRAKIKSNVDGTVYILDLDDFWAT